MLCLVALLLVAAPSSAPLALGDDPRPTALLLCCDALGDDDDKGWEALMPRLASTRPLVLVWDRSGVERCERQLARRGRSAQRVEGTLATVWSAVATSRLLVVDGNVQGPLSSFAAHSALPTHGMELAFAEVAVMPRRATGARARGAWEWSHARARAVQWRRTRSACGRSRLRSRCWAS